MLPLKAVVDFAEIATVWSERGSGCSVFRLAGASSMSTELLPPAAEKLLIKALRGLCGGLNHGLGSKAMCTFHSAKSVGKVGLNLCSVSQYVL